MFTLFVYVIGVRGDEAVDVSYPQSGAGCALRRLLGLSVRHSRLLQCLVLHAVSQGTRV